MLDRASVYGDQGFWMRQAYREGVRNRSITAVVRIGDRSDPGHKNYIPPGVLLPIRFIASMKGVDPGVLGNKGNLLPDDGTTFVRTGCIVKAIGDLDIDTDFQGMAPDSRNHELVRYHLATVNDTELPSWDTVVTIWRFEYRPDVVA